MFGRLRLLSPDEGNPTVEIHQADDAQVHEAVTDHAESLGELRARMEGIETWRTEWTQRQEETQSTLSQLLSNVREIGERVAENARIPEVVMPLPLEELNEADNPENPESDGPADAAANQTTHTGSVLAMSPVRNAPSERQSHLRRLRIRR